MTDKIPKDRMMAFRRGFIVGFVPSSSIWAKKRFEAHRRIDVSIEAVWADVGDAFTVAFELEGKNIGKLKRTKSGAVQSRKPRRRATEAA